MAASDKQGTENSIAESSTLHYHGSKKSVITATAYEETSAKISVTTTALSVMKKKSKKKYSCNCKYGKTRCNE